jgi:hypothetical protein
MSPTRTRAIGIGVAVLALTGTMVTAYAAGNGAAEKKADTITACVRLTTRGRRLTRCTRLPRRGR